MLSPLRSAGNENGSKESDMDSRYDIDEPAGVISSLGLVLVSFTSEIGFHDDRFCHKVFDRLWRKREHQTCIQESDSFKHLDLRKLELKFGESTQLCHFACYPIYSCRMRKYSSF